MSKPKRKVLPHQPPLSIDTGQHDFFITICSAERRGRPLLPQASALLKSVKAYSDHAKWYPRIFLVMPDHVHGIFRFPSDALIEKTIQDWKRWTCRFLKIDWQDGFFDHRLRREESVSDKTDYIFQNPVRAGLVADPQDWPHVWFAAGE